MSNVITESSIFRILTDVMHPDFPDRNLVVLGMIPDVCIENDLISVTLALPSLVDSNDQALVNIVKQSIEQIAEDLAVRVNVTQMEPDQLSKFSALTDGSQVDSNPLRHINTVIAVMSGKGGVGKSTIAGLLASSLRQRGFRVGVLDADITGPSIPMIFGAHQMPIAGTQGIVPVCSRTGIKLMSINLLLSDKDQPVVWRGPLIGRAIQQFWEEIEWGELDFLILDLPPGTADASLTVMQSFPLDGIVLVTSPQDLAGLVVRKAANMAKHLGIQLIGLVENMSHIICPKCGERIFVFGESQVENSAEMIGTPVLGNLPLDTLLSVLCDFGKIEDYHSEELDHITDQLIDFVSTKKAMSSEAVPAR
jgi:Mrp family chromosome partitioning ATPase